MSVTEQSAEPRTDEQIIGRVPIKVQLGGKQYELHPLSIAKSRVWRGKLSDVLNEVTGQVDLKVSTLDGLIKAISGMALAMPEKLLDLLFSYAPNLPREIIEDTATDDEAMIAFREIVRLAFPFVAHLSLLTAMGKKTTQ